ncbi:hypothetical protein [Winogradskyella helgolandensis]|uniref:hypothetical protein n=1 Tax=Winogradskyella helgolandensis TaxID=2697010 RepID=UPI0015CC380A|nr:hypothetical protein [Winogradskyella helgolandensis]
MNKKLIKYSKNGVVIFGLTNAFINAIQQINSIKEIPEQNFDWSELLKAGGKGALLGGVGGAFIGGIVDSNNAKKERLNTSAILSTVVSNIRLDKNNSIYKKLSIKANRIINDLEIYFNNSLGGSPLKIGSTEEGTSLSDSFDIDISVPFSSNSFNSTSEMYHTLYEYFDENYSDKDFIRLRKQKKSIGIIYRINGEDYKIDVVPYKLSKTINNKTAGYLYVNNNSFFKKDSYTKTDIISLKSIKLTTIQQKLLIALKKWKKEYSIPISSHLLKMLIIDAYEINKGNIPRDFTKKILMTITYIEENIMYRRITSIENTNNILTDFDESDKLLIKKECNNIISDYKYRPNSILKYFDFL